jgi:hypothetical protein
MAMNDNSRWMDGGDGNSSGVAAEDVNKVNDSSSGRGVNKM